MTAQPLLSAEALAGVQLQDRGIERWRVTDRASWLAMRQQDITASVAGALLGVHEYQTPYGLWALKSGQITEDVEETPPMRRGRLLEPVALKLLAEERPAWSIEVGQHYFRDPAARIGATPDAFAVDPNRPGFGIVQVKTVEPGIFRKKWRADEEFGEAEPPLWIVIQAIVEAELTGASWACVVAMTVSFGVDLHVVEIPLHAGVMARLREAVAEFWRKTAAGDAFEPDYAKDAALIARLIGSDDGSMVDLSGDNIIPALADEDEILAEEIKTRTERRKAIKAEALAKIGVAASATINGRVVLTAKTVHRKGYEVKPCSYRDVRFKRSA